MMQLKETGSYEITQDMKEFMKDFVSGYSTEEEVREEIVTLYTETGFVIDPHTAVAAHVYETYRAETKDTLKTVIASTASPFKFAQTVAEALDLDAEGEDILKVIDLLSSAAKMPQPEAVREVREGKILHNLVCGKEEIKETVAKILNL